MLFFKDWSLKPTMAVAMVGASGSIPAEDGSIINYSVKGMFMFHQKKQIFDGNKR